MTTRSLPVAESAPRTCVACWLAVALLLLAVWGSFRYLAIDAGLLFSAESRGYLADFIGRFFPPDLSAPFLVKVGRGALETLAISVVSIVLAIAAGLLLALPGSGRFGAPARSLTRFLLNCLRSVPELVWGALMVLAAGLGPFAGTLALALHTAGVLGRLFSETLENAPPQPARALVESGARPSLAFLYGTLPSILPQLVAYSLYRWEMNVRMATVLGFVGAGGLGQLLYYELSLLHEPQACTVILAMLLIVVGIDVMSAWIRRRYLPSGT
jgi:phosphonate transport system permease protein